MRIKHTGQRSLPTNPKHNAGAYHAMLAKRAICNLDEDCVPTYVYQTSVPVTYKRRRKIAAPAEA